MKALALLALLAGCNALFGEDVQVVEEPCAMPLPPCGASAVPVAGDWDGDHHASPGLFDAGRWCITNRRAAGAVCLDFRWGAAGDTPLVGDWSGRGADSAGWFRDTRWSLRDARDGDPAEFGWGNAAMTAVVGDWDARGADTPGGARGVATGVVWSLSNHNSGGGVDHEFGWGPIGAAIYLVGDWDGDGRDTPAWYRAGRWVFSNVNSGGGIASEFTWGSADDVPVVGDWDGDGFDTIGLYRDGTWTLADDHVDTLDGTQGPAAAQPFRWGRDP